MKNRIFIVGVEGSGTTMLSRILGSLSNSASVLGNYVSQIAREDINAKRMISKLHRYTTQMWDIDGTLEQLSDVVSNVPTTIESMEKYLQEEYGVNRFIYKRSSPFLEGNRHIPDLLQVLNVFSNPMLIIMIRDPKQSSFSALRRGFFKDIKQCAIACHINLTLLSSIKEVLDGGLIINYNAFCSNPKKIARQISDFLEIDYDDLMPSIEKEKITQNNQDRYLRELDSSSIEFLNDYFTQTRIKTYKIFK